MEGTSLQTLNARAQQARTERTQDRQQLQDQAQGIMESAFDALEALDEKRHAVVHAERFATQPRGAQARSLLRQGMQQVGRNACAALRDIELTRQALKHVHARADAALCHAMDAHMQLRADMLELALAARASMGAPMRAYADRRVAALETQVRQEAAEFMQYVAGAELGVQENLDAGRYARELEEQDDLDRAADVAAAARMRHTEAQASANVAEENTRAAQQENRDAEALHAEAWRHAVATTFCLAASRYTHTQWISLQYAVQYGR